MKSIAKVGRQIASAFLILAFASGCKDTSTLDAAKAQVAVNAAMQQISSRWKLSPGNAPIQAQIQGIQQSPDGTGAQADLVFSGISLTCQPAYAIYKEVWQRGTAVFKRYTDGRWVLSEIHVEGEAYHYCGGGWTGSISVN